MNVLNTIKRDCIRDHAKIISGYVNEQVGGKINNSISSGNERLQKIQQIMYDLTRYHPQIMSYILRRSNSDISQKTIIDNYVQSGGGKAEDIKKLIQQVDALYNNLKQNKEQESKIADYAKIMMDRLDEIKTSLEKVDDKNISYDPELVANNMLTVINTLKKFDPSSLTYQKHTQARNIYIPTKNVDRTIYNENVTLTDTANTIIKEYINSLPKLSDEQKRQFNEYIDRNNYVDLLNNLMKINLSDIDSRTLEDKLEKTIQKLNSNNEKIGDLSDTLNESVNQINNYMFGLDSNVPSSSSMLSSSFISSSDIPSSFAIVRTNILPKLREIIMVIGHMKNSDIDIGKNYGELYSDYINMEHNNIKYRIILEDFSKLINELFEKAKNMKDKVTITEFINSCDKMNISQIIGMYEERITNSTFTSIIEKYNKINEQNPNLVVKLNNYLAENVKEIFTPESDYKMKVIKTLNISIARDISKGKADSSVQDYILIQKNLIKNTDGSIKLSIPISKNDSNYFHEYNSWAHEQEKNGINLEKHNLLLCIKMIPRVYFLRDYTERIYNNIFDQINGENIDKINLLSGLFSDIGIDQTKNIKTGISSDISAEMIYKPDFGKIKEKMKDMKKLRDAQRGGFNSLIKILNELSRTNMRAVIKGKEFNNASDRYIVAYNDMYSYIRYLLLIATNQFFTENYVVYKYMNKGTIELYKRIATGMIRDITSGSNDYHIQYVRKYYRVIVQRLGFFLERLSNMLTSPYDIIDIKEIKGVDATSMAIRNDFMLLNYFKPIMESYNEIFQNQITIYARLNDIVGDIGYSSKVFVSDNEHYGNTNCSYDEHVNKICDKRGYTPITNKTAGNPSIMWTKQSLCTGKQEDDTPTKFTEVFDSVNFPENSDISKYMTLETQLAKGKGVCLLTYGYSGTGKTYTLFGNESKQGLLQSTLVNINGLSGVDFRLFELHGYGIPYDLYWNNRDRTSRMDDISHGIHCYNLRNTSDNIEIDDDPEKVIDSRGIKDFMNGRDGMIHIKGQFVKDIFNNFSKLTASVDNHRKKENRIRETPNNPESSRSILIYDFRLHVGKNHDNDAVKFLIVDLPGREELTETYIRPYLGNNVMRDILKGDTDIIRMLLTCMMLNPMAVSIFDPEIILDTVNSIDDAKIRKDIYAGILEYKINNNRKLDYIANLKNDKLEVKQDIPTVAKTPSNKNVINEKEQSNYGFGYDTPEQRLSILAIFVIYNLILKNKFGVINELYGRILDERINSKINAYVDSISDIPNIYQNLIKTRFKGETTLNIVREMLEIKSSQIIDTDDLINMIGTKSKENQDLWKEKLKQILKYDYILTPFEGIYINENIIGLIKYLSDQLVPDEEIKATIEVLNKDQVTQPHMDLDTLRNLARTWLMSQTREPDDIKKKFGITPKEYSDIYTGMMAFENNILKFEIDKLNQKQQYLIDQYKSNKIYNFDKPIITDIMDPYIYNPKYDEQKNKSAIKNYKLFYLFGNYSDDSKTKFKCEHQIKLLNNTENFIKAISS